MLKKFLLYFLKPIPHYSNVVILNLFGFQIIRFLIFRFYIGTKKALYKKLHYKKFNSLKKEYEILLNKLEKDGCITIENIFSEEDFDIISNLTNRISDENLIEYKDDASKSPVFKYYNLNSNQLEKFFDSNIFLSKIKKNKVISDLFFLLNYSNLENNMISFQKIKPVDLENQGHINSQLHTDRFYKFHKFFISINDVKKENAAFKYCKASHKYSLKKHFFEYQGSIFESFNSLFKYFFPILKFDRYLVKDYLKLNVSNIESNKNSLIIENGSGFHAAGEFEDIKMDRKYIRINPLNANHYYYLPFALYVLNFRKKLK